MDRKILGLIIAAVIVCAVAVSAVAFFLVPPQGTPKELDFTVTGTNDCLRFLNSTVSVVYVPIATGANENWQLTINCTKNLKPFREKIIS